jgi:hypothetical protein
LAPKVTGCSKVKWRGPEILFFEYFHPLESNSRYFSIFSRQTTADSKKYRFSAVYHRTAIYGTFFDHSKSPVYAELHAELNEQIKTHKIQKNQKFTAKKPLLLLITRRV